MVEVFRMCKAKTFLAFWVLVGAVSSASVGEGSAPRIMYFLDPARPTHVYVNQGKADGLMVGAVLTSYRAGSTDPGELIQTGELKIVTLFAKGAIAKVVKSSSKLAAHAFPLNPKLMAGDLVQTAKLTIRHRQHIMPEKMLPYTSLFKNPHKDPSSFQISALGHKHLKETADLVGDKRFTYLIIKGYTDRDGNRGRNQTESLQRAMTVKQYMVEHFGFAEDRVFAVGVGEDEVLDNTFTSGHAQRNRRIVFKVVPHAR
jgi:outer membrane protein OmpA-like peptidoglycan-associated protein